MNNKDTYNIICSFLMPIDIVVMRTLSSYHNIWTDKYILDKYHKKNIEEYTCPKCGSWLSDEDISNYTDFNDYFLLDDTKMSRFHTINEWFNKNYIFNVIRKSLVCDMCEYEEDYSEYIINNFRYKGTRTYNIISYHGLYSWASIYLIDHVNNIGYWNEYRKILCHPLLHERDENNIHYDDYIYDVYDVYDDNEDDED